ncbi:hypothetical protein U1Q18_047911 [Sarracenia purpurea var. burkii]
MLGKGSTNPGTSMATKSVGHQMIVDIGRNQRINKDYRIGNLKIFRHDNTGHVNLLPTNIGREGVLILGRNQVVIKLPYKIKAHISGGEKQGSPTTPVKPTWHRRS